MSEISLSIGISVISSFAIFSFLIGIALSSSLFVSVLVPLPTSSLGTSLAPLPSPLAFFLFGICSSSSSLTDVLVPLLSSFIGISSSTSSSTASGGLSGEELS